MNADQLNTFRTQACFVVQQLGACLDALQTAGECSRVPGEPAADALCTVMHLEEAACAVESAATFVHDLAVRLDRQIEAEKRAAGALVGGAS